MDDICANGEKVVCMYPYVDGMSALCLKGYMSDSFVSGHCKLIVMPDCHCPQISASVLCFDKTTDTARGLRDSCHTRTGSCAHFSLTYQHPDFQGFVSKINKTISQKGHLKDDIHASDVTLMRV